VEEKKEGEEMEEDEFAHERMYLGTAMARQSRREIPSECLTEENMKTQKNNK